MQRLDSTTSVLPSSRRYPRVVVAILDVVNCNNVPGVEKRGLNVFGLVRTLLPTAAAIRLVGERYSGSSEFTAMIQVDRCITGCLGRC